MKRCIICEEEKPTVEFGSALHTRDRKRRTCLDCELAEPEATVVVLQREHPITEDLGVEEAPKAHDLKQAARYIFTL